MSTLKGILGKCETVLDTKRCPVCEYPTRGLQSPFRCPECGAQYDLTTVVCRPGLRWTIMWFSFSALPCTVALLSLLLRGMSDAVVWLFGAGVMWFPLAWTRYRKTRMLLLLSERTVLLYRHDRTPQILSYENITGVEVKKLTGDVCLVAANGQEEIIVPYDFFGSSKAARRFVDMLRERVPNVG